MTKKRNDFKNFSSVSQKKPYGGQPPRSASIIF